MRMTSRGCAVAVALLAVAGIAGCSSSKKSEAPSATVPPVTTLSTTPFARQSLEFRAVKLVVSTSSQLKAVGQSPSKSERCTSVVTPVSQRKPTNASEMLLDRRRAFCYLLGPALVTSSSVSTASAIYDLKTAQWGVDVHFTNSDFLTKVVRPLAGKQIAIVLAGFVQSAPQVNAGISGSDAEIFGGFTRTGAIDVAAAILGIAPSAVRVVSPAG
jgi:preprotein translocase subunit SecD